ncbi:MAG: phosphate-starvation-inducible PsiE family protein, partial [Desulfobulbia bacterium]
MSNQSSSAGPTYETFILSNEWHSCIVGFFIGLFLIVIYLWMASGLISLLLNLYHSFPNNWAHGAESM